MSLDLGFRTYGTIIKVRDKGTGVLYAVKRFKDTEAPEVSSQLILEHPRHPQRSLNPPDIEAAPTHCLVN
jgi:hypothetical protein